MSTKYAVSALVVALSASVLAGCGGSSEDTDLKRAQAKVDNAQQDLADAQATLTEKTTAFCDAGKTYIVALDRYGDLLTSTAPTVGDVTTAGSDLDKPQDATLDAADEAVSAQADVTQAQQDLAEAQAALEAVKTGKTPSATPSATASVPPLAPEASVNRVKQAQTELDSTRSGISDQTPLTQATQEFNAAVVALEMSWLQLFSDAGCLDDQQQKEATSAVHDYTVALQTSLAKAGYYDGEVDGIYGPKTVAAVEALQQKHSLPTTGTVDKATAAALQSDLLAVGGEAAQEELVSTTALQQTLKIAGYWDGPVDGAWTPALTEALKQLQKDLGVKETGTVDAATIAAFEKAIATLGQPVETPSATPSTTPSQSPTQAPSSS